MVRNREWVEQRIERVTESGCWIWLGSISIQSGYGKVRVLGKMFKAHRVSYELYRGAIPDGLLVLHECDVPCCVNPGHLKTGTHADNGRDMTSRGRTQGRKQGCDRQWRNVPRDRINEAPKLNEAKALRIKFGDEPAQALATEFGITTSAVRKIRGGHRWAHLAR